MARRTIPTRPQPQPKVEEAKVEEPVVEKQDENSESEPTTKKVKVISKNKLRLRAGDSTSAETLSLLNPGDELEVLAEGSEWTKVKAPIQVGYAIGYVMSKFVK